MRTLAALISTVLACMALGQPGTLDPTFGTNGVTVHPVGAGTGTPFDLVVQPDDRIVLAGFASNGTDNDFMVVRFTADGFPDGTFGTNGVVLLDLGANDRAACVELQADGKILVGGSTLATEVQAAVIRLNTDGTLDPAFGTGGTFVLPHPTAAYTSQSCADMRVLANGKIILVGTSVRSDASDRFTVWRLNSNGTLDGSFSSFGFGQTNRDVLGDNLHDQAYAFAMKPDSSYVLAGRSLVGADYRMSLAYVLPNSMSPGGFNDGAWDFGGAIDQANAIVLLPNGNQVLVGTTSGNLGMACVSPTGTIVSGFGTGGKVVVDLSATMITSDAIKDHWEKILVVGSDFTAPTTQLYLYRFNGADGSFDNAFGTGGQVALTAVPDTWTHGRTLGLQSDGRIVVAGYTETVTADDLFVARFNNDNTTQAGNEDQEPGLRAYPNPSTDRVMISGTRKGDRIEVLNALGEKLAVIGATDMNSELHLSALPAGTYPVRIVSPTGVRSARIAKVE